MNRKTISCSEFNDSDNIVLYGPHACGPQESRMSKINVVGAGTWGIALARMLSNSGHEVKVWSALPS